MCLRKPNWTSAKQELLESAFKIHAWRGFVLRSVSEKSEKQDVKSVKADLFFFKKEENEDDWHVFRVAGLYFTENGWCWRRSEQIAFQFQESHVCVVPFPTSKGSSSNSQQREGCFADRMKHGCRRRVKIYLKS